jgi:hypothetical protein
VDQNWLLARSLALYQHIAPLTSHNQFKRELFTWRQRVLEAFATNMSHSILLFPRVAKTDSHRAGQLDKLNQKVTIMSIKMSTIFAANFSSSTRPRLYAKVSPYQVEGHDRSGQQRASAHVSRFAGCLRLVVWMSWSPI